jgi:hypothetical protein
VTCAEMAEDWSQCSPIGLNGNADIARKLPVYYDWSRTSFWVQNDRGGWVMIKTPDVRRSLIEQGFQR